ncbi:hypothetical protein LJC08_03395 [Methanimicrococcus sp. OttesenSCG-928-J09]|nr:hypothetical protein [Methanimicrococcus sp. OttesenSCG-928-J09]
MYSKELAELGFVVFRRQNDNGGMKPHLFIRFKSKDGRLLTFAVDTTRLPANQNPPDAYLITHAHSDHYGKSAMLSDKSWCSEETARALEIRYEKTYQGQTFKTGEIVDICGVPVQTFDVFHTPGSSAFYWENELGNSIMVTGDVKDASLLPKCDVLLTEASYGDPDDLSCYFKDDISALHHAVLSNVGKRRIAFGAYEFGKSQKAVSIIREMGYNGPISMNGKTLSLTESFVSNAGDLIELGIEDSASYSVRSATLSFSQTQITGQINTEPAAPGGVSIQAAAVAVSVQTSYSAVQVNLAESDIDCSSRADCSSSTVGSSRADDSSGTDCSSRVDDSSGTDGSSTVGSGTKCGTDDSSDCSICIVPVHELAMFGRDTQKYVLTCRPDYPFEIIKLSDHLDVDGLTQMVKNINPRVTIIYHPNKSSRTDRFSKHLIKNGFKAFSINQIQNIVKNEKLS